MHRFTSETCVRPHHEQTSQIPEHRLPTVTWRAIIRRVARVTTIGAVALGLAACGLFQGSSQSSSQISRYVLATNVLSNQGPETRISTDAVLWSNPGFPIDVNGQTYSAQSNLAPGVGIAGGMAVLTWFDPSGVLMSADSTDGVNWRNAQSNGRFTVNSNATLSVIRSAGRWHAGFVDASNQLVIHPIHIDSGPRPPTLRRAVVQGSRARMATDGRRIVVALSGSFGNQSSGAELIAANDVRDLISAIPILARDSQDNSPLLTGGNAPGLIVTSQIVRLIVHRGAQALAFSSYWVYDSTDLASWTRTQELSPAAPPIPSWAAAGTASTLLVAGQRPPGRTDILRVGNPPVTLNTETQAGPDLAFGPLIASPPTESFRILFVSYSPQQPASGTETVELRATHLDRRSREIALTTWSRSNLQRNTPNAFTATNEPGATAVPQLTGIGLPGERIRVTLRTSAGLAEGDLAMDQLIGSGSQPGAAGPVGGARLQLQIPGQQTSYSLRYEYSAQ